MNDALLIINVSLLMVYFILTLFKNLFNRVKSFYEYINIISLILIYLIAINNLAINKMLLLFIYLFVLIFLNGYIIYQLLIIKATKKAFFEKANQLIKNAPFDYYLQTDVDDKIIDFSDSFLDLVHLSPDELYNTLGFQTIISELSIININGEKISENRAVRFNYEYNGTKINNVTKYVELSILENEEIRTLNVIIEPIYLKNKFIGRNLYFTKDNKDTLDKIEKELLNLKEIMLNDRSNVYCMMSLIKNIVMYYDYHSAKYILTENTFKRFNFSKRELSVNEFIALIHPDDILLYQEQSAVITSIEATRITYRLKLGDNYFVIHDDSMYLNKDANLISLISLNDMEELTNDHNQSIKEDSFKVSEEVLSPKEIDYQAKLENAISLLTKILDE